MFVKDSKDIGIQLNTSFVGNDKDGYTAGAHIVTSDGLDISNEIKNDSLDGAIQELMTGIIKEAILSKVENKKENAKTDSQEDAKTKKMRELEDKLRILAEEMDEVHSRMVEFEDRYRDLDSKYEAVEDELYALEDEEEEEDSRPTLDDILDFDGDFLDYLRSLNIS